ncbi:MAG TPA: c-type cytochrome [Steroidobacteraceae bacterium]|nr:c-type cytochrome [Steroidobacteraceae bacterium]
MSIKVRRSLIWGGVVSFAAAFAGSHPAHAGVVDLRRIVPIQGDAAAGAQKSAVCAACHGADGAPTAPLFPRLSGQRPDYLYHRLVAFHSADPKSPYYSTSAMTPLAAQLSDRDMRDLAVYFASQSPKAAPAQISSPDSAATVASPAAPSSATPEATRGQQIFLAGNSSRGIPPCQGCHGPDANGSRIRSGQYAVYPALRGQSGPFVVSRLKSFRDGLPADTSSALIMGGVAHNLDDDSIESLAAWLSSLTPERSF